MVLTFQEPKITNSSETLSVTPVVGWVDKSNNQALSLQKFAKRNPNSLRGTFLVTESTTQGRNLNELWKEYVEDSFPETFDNYEMLEKGDKVIDNQNAKFIVFKYSDRNIDFITMSTIFIKGDILFIITCASTSSFYESVESDFVKMIDSIQLK